MTGRGRPAAFSDAVRQQYLAAVADGMRLGEAAHHLGVSINLPRRHARTDPAFAEALTVAKAQGKKLRDDRKPHSEGHYNHQDCRNPDCGTASRRGRATRRARAAASQPEAQAAEVHDLRPELPHPLPLARAS